MAQQYSLRTANFSGGKAFGILIDSKGYAHCIFLLSLIFAGRERVKQETAVDIAQNEAVVVVVELIKRGKFFWDTRYIPPM